jgi:pSer/pThr/pTyr-binding forkhead associated (FHA) protein
MKLRLEITTSPDNTFAFEHTGPSLRIGRDPSAELSLQGEASQSVSWEHARIELTPSGAYLSDLKSSNGTLLNDRRVVAATPLKLSDQIQLGHTGPMLRIVLLDLSPAQQAEPSARRAAPRAPIQPTSPPPDYVKKEPAPPAPRAAAVPPPPPKALPIGPRGEAGRSFQRNMLIGIGAVALVALVLAGVAVLKRPSPADSNSSNSPVVSADKGQPAPTPVQTTGPTNPSVQQETPLPKQPDKPPPEQIPKKERKPDGMPKVERKEVGRYQLQEKIPSVLLVHQLGANLLGRVRPEDRIETGCYLTSLPGYRSKLVLDSGVQMMLWGNVPEFSLFPPVLESTVMLHPPDPGVDLEFTLDRGRVQLANFKPKAEAHVRVHFQRETWDLFLPNQQTEVVLELFGQIPGVPIPKQPAEPLTFVGIFVKGEARLKIGEQEQKLPNSSGATWSSISPAVPKPQAMPQLPDWWAGQLDPRDPVIGNMMVALADYSDRLAKDEEILPAIVTMVKGNEFVPHRALGVWFLGAVDAVLQLVDALEDAKRPEVRRAAATALWHWTNRRSDNEQALYRTLRETKQYGEDETKIIMRLLHSITEAEFANRTTYETLIGYLNHKDLAIRELAFWHLFLLVPESAKGMDYDSAEVDPEKRKVAVEQWRKLISEGKLPPRRQ